MLNNKNVLRLVSLVIAICLWIYVMGEVNPETKAKIGDVKVSFTNAEMLTDAGLAVAEQDEIFISVTVKGKRSDVNDVKKTGLTAYADVMNCEEGVNTVNITVNLPEGIKLENISRSTAEVKVEKLVTESRPVKIVFSGEDPDNDMIPWAIDYKPAEIYVSGAQSSVKDIDHINGVIETENVTEDLKNVEAVLYPVNKDGDEISEITMSYEIAYADVQLLSTKMVNLKVEPVNLYSGLTIDEVDADKAVTIVGDAETLESIESLEAELDLNGMFKNGKAQIDINLPEGVYLYNKEVTSVNVTFKDEE